MKSIFNETEMSQRKLLEAEKRFNFNEQINRSDVEARAQVAEKIIRLAVFLNVVLFLFIGAAMWIDQYNVIRGVYHDQLVSDRLLGGLIAGVVLEIVGALCCFIRYRSSWRGELV